MNGYDIDLFSELTGLELEESQLPVFERALNRAFSMIENELGWSFNYISNYKDSRNIIKKIEREKIVETLVKSYLRDLQ